MKVGPPESPESKLGAVAFPSTHGKGAWLYRFGQARRGNPGWWGKNSTRVSL